MRQNELIEQERKREEARKKKEDEAKKKKDDEVKVGTLIFVCVWVVEKGSVKRCPTLRSAHVHLVPPCSYRREARLICPSLSLHPTLQAAEAAAKAAAPTPSPEVTQAAAKVRFLPMDMLANVAHNTTAVV